MLNIISDLADVTITGKFIITDLVEAISLEVKLLASAIERKIEAIQPPKFFDNTVVNSKLLLDENEFQNIEKSPVMFRTDIQHEIFHLLALVHEFVATRSGPRYSAGMSAAKFLVSYRYPVIP